jgi:ABC-type Fe3+ transport system substrate-binding protein
MAQSPATQPPTAESGSVLVHGTLDRPAVEPIIAGFHALHPELRIRYHELNSIELYDAFLDAVDARRPTPDLVMSSAIDLQMKLVNDGHALAHSTREAAQLPSWAIWRNEAFAFSLEPVVTVYNATLLEPNLRPSSRYRLLDLLRAHADRFVGKVGTYDPAVSGTGYLYLTQDIEQSPIVWELTRAFGNAGVRLFSTSSGIINAVASGDLLVGYNVVGSYAFARASTNAALEVVLPEDYTLVVPRTAFIAKRGRNPEFAGAFLNFLLSARGQQILVDRSALLPIRTDVEGPSMVELSRKTFRGARPVRMSPGLLVYVDSIKREKVLRRWRDAIRSGVP